MHTDRLASLDRRMSARCYSVILHLSSLNTVSDVAYREDISANLHVLEELQQEYNCEMLLVESGGDNLAATYSRELADYIIYVVSPPDLPNDCKLSRKLRLMLLEVTRYQGKVGQVSVRSVCPV